MKAILFSIALLVQFAIQAQVYDMRELNTDQIRALDLERTVVLMSVGILEQHGPYLPSYTDGYVNEFIVNEIAKAVVERPNWTVLIFPPIPLGAGGANQIGFKHIFPGTYHIHFQSLRSVVMDLAAEFGEAGFKWVFIVSRHGSAAHKRALDQASDFFTETSNGVMVHLDGIIPPDQRPVDLGLSDKEMAENGFDIHAGMNETSRILFLHPELVHSGYKTAIPYSGRNWSELVDLGKHDKWLGYFGSPRLATAARGETIMREFSHQSSVLVLKILDGLDVSQLKRQLSEGAFSSASDKGRVEYSQESDRHEGRIEAKKNAWLKSKGY